MNRRVIILAGSCILALFFALVMTTRGFRLVGRTGVHTVAAAAGLDKTSLVAWYDFTSDGSDAHSVGPYNLTTNGTPAHTNGYFIGVAGSPGTGYIDTSTNSNLGISWNTGEADASFAMRFRPRTGLLSGHWPHQNKSTRFGVRYFTTGGGITTRFKNIFDDSGTTGATNVWYSLIANYTSTGVVETFVNNSSDGPTTGSVSLVNGLTGYFPGAPSAHVDCEIDYAVFYERVLTTNEIEWLYNSGGTRTYSELAD